MQLATNPTQPFAAPPALAVCWTEMVSHRKDLVRFAQRRLQDPMLAEDVVHDVFEAVLSGRAAFAGRAALRSWLTAVLKNKIVDLVRRRAGTDSLEEQNDADGVLNIACPQPGPHEAAEQRELLAQTLARIDALPAPLRDVMRLRVLQDQPTEAVCKTLAITPENLFVRLHRARAQLMNRTGSGAAGCAGACAEKSPARQGVHLAARAGRCQRPQRSTSGSSRRA